jgi:Mycobacterium membrane protein
MPVETGYTRGCHASLAIEVHRTIDPRNVRYGSLPRRWRSALHMRSSHRACRTRRMPSGGLTISLIKRIWIPIVMILVLALGAITVSRLHGVFGSHQHVADASNADAIVAFNPKHVVYEVLGPTGTVATINYLDAEAQPQMVNDATLPWSLTIVTTLTAVVADVVAQGDSASLRCRITVNGVVRDERIVEAHHAQTSCLVKSA